MRERCRCWWIWSCLALAEVILGEETEKTSTTRSTSTTEEVTTTWTDPTTTRGKDLEPAWLDASWHASSWSDCTSCYYGPVQIRKVQCLSIWQSAVLPEDHCLNIRKPPETQDCNCDQISCTGNTAACPSKKAEWFEPEFPYIQLGCYNLGPSHVVRTGDDLYKGNYLDLTCAQHTGDEPCNSGLPFFSFSSNAMSPASCFSSCADRGMDIMGLVNGVECRCGFSAINRNAHFRAPVSEGLEFIASRLRPFSSTKDVCPLRVFRYCGHFEAGGLPLPLVKLTDGEIGYLREIFHHWKHQPEENDVLLATHPPTTPTPRGHHGPAKVDLEKAKDERHYSHQSGDAWERSCYPENCGPGDGPWPKRIGAAPPGVFDQFNLYCPIPYIFGDNVDDARKDVFRTAVRRWHQVTCIVLIEYQRDDLSDDVGPYIEVDVVDQDSCYATRIGYPGYWLGRPDKAIINLGWCNSIYQLGSVIHEIGHVLGMNHEQKRSDATERVNGHGPYLRIFWDQLEHSTWKGQYLPDHETYLGSNLQGSGDPHSGFAAYDYASIMHYGLTGKFEPLESENAELLGNRDHLAESDILQMNDMYQCKALSTPALNMDCEFETSLCNWMNVGDDPSTFEVRCADTPHGTGPDFVSAAGRCYLYAEAKDHPWEVFTIESPGLSSTRDYVLELRYWRTSIASKFSVQYETVLGKSVEVYKDHGNRAKEWIYKEVNIFGEKAVTVRIVVTTTDNIESGAAVDHVKLIPRAEVSSSGSSGNTLLLRAHHQEENLFQQWIDALGNMLDSIFSKKYARDQEARKEAINQSGRRWLPGQALGLIAFMTMSVGMMALVFRHRRHTIEEQDEEPLMEVEVPELMSAREFVRSQVL